MTREELNKILVEHHFQLISEHNNKCVTTYTYTCNISYLNRFITFNVLNGSDDIYNDSVLYEIQSPIYHRTIDSGEWKGIQEVKDYLIRNNF